MRTRELYADDVGGPRRRIDTSDGFSAPYPFPAATESNSYNNWRSADPSNPGPSDEKLAVQRKAIQKSPDPCSWRRFVASRALDRDARAIRLLQQREQQRGSRDLERGC